MEAIRIEDVSDETAEDLAWLCVPKDRREDLVFRKGVDAKLAWIKERLRSEEPFAKIAYLGEEAAGILQYRVHPDLNIVQILCIFVPERRHWNRGVGKGLLAGLVEEMRGPQPWNGGRVPEYLIVHTFPGQAEGQLSAREFFRCHGFVALGDDPDLLIFPLGPAPRFPGNFRLETFSPPPAYQPQPEDAGHVVIVYGPSFCPWVYRWWVKGEELLRHALPEAPIRWVDGVASPQELEKRGGFTGVVVNGRAMRHSVFEEEEFLKEAQEAWRKGGNA